MNALYEREIGGLTLTIEQDNDPSNPIENSVLWKLLCWHHRYTFGHEHHYTQPSEFEEEWKGKAITMPLYLYDHSGFSLSIKQFNDPWDSMRLGYAYTTKEKLRQFFHVKRVTKKVIAQAVAVLELKIREYEDYLNGYVYSFTLVDQQGNFVDQCGNFFGVDFSENGLLSSVPEIFKEDIANL